MSPLIQIYITEFDNVLFEIEETIRKNGNRNTIISGDLNTKSPMWGPNKENWRGTKLIDLANMLDLRLLNVGKTPTCVRPQGVSVVDTTRLHLYSKKNPGMESRSRNYTV